ncbi:GLPGLI family protein [Chryseobacterium fluminis]|uniref:GLPGLI family protein n=1 Tax=Chryseobacterium fluminis TaxID=2983606 RepID=UPI00224C95D8|nr:GLPGLI family protein [Chryseobacterium sp. MMS21-Ot14]UZT96938.1 GLPGLI family protein [Chryseobacterium sp. MMS21-Ot14]
MKYLFIIPLFFLTVIKIKSQEINRFFYEVTYMPKKDSLRKESAMMVLDIRKDESEFKDYQSIITDSLANESLKKMQKTGTFENPPATKNPSFSYAITKTYPSMEIQFTEGMMNGLTPIILGYKENIRFDWKIEKEKQKFGEYTAQKATLNFGGRKWIAWFSTDLPFSDGPYKFHGLPGLIIKIEDTEKNYSWILKGNKKAADNSNNSLMSKLTNGNIKIVDKQKFTKTFENYKQNPLMSMRSELTPQILSMKMPGTDMKISEFVDKQGKEMQEAYKMINNPVEKQ